MLKQVKNTEIAIPMIFAILKNLYGAFFIENFCKR